MSFESIFAGKMLGDGYITLNRQRARFSFIHALRDENYAKYCYELFLPYIPYGKNCTKIEHIVDKRSNNTYSRVSYQSKTAKLLDELYRIWYVNNRKVVPMDFIEKYFDVQGLAIWYQDDGSYKQESDRVILSTESFNIEEIRYLQDLLRERFRIHSGIDCQKRLDISSRSEVRKFLTLVEPFIHSSMERKSMSSNWMEWEASWNRIKSCKSGISRTTIYLPFDLYNNIAGVGYSQLLNNFLDKWLEQIWKSMVQNHSMLYEWILKHQPVNKGTYRITPRFRADIKKRLDLMSYITGFEISELVIIALQHMQ